MIIAIPSKGRAGKTTSQRILPNGIFYVPQSEVHQYEGVVKNVVGVPKTVLGITPTRNWILENTDEKRIVFVDDDVRTVGYTKMHERNSQKIDILSEEFWLQEFMKMFDLTEQLGYKIWGVKTEAAPRSVLPYKPLLLKAYVTASCMGIINDGSYLFNESFIVKEDYEICLRHIVQEGGILAARYLHWENSHWGDEGGCKDYRTVAIEKKAIQDLIRMYPTMVKTIKRKANVFTIKLNL